VNPGTAAAIDAAIGAATGLLHTSGRREPLGGGCINRGYALTGCDGRRFFAKLNHASRIAMFEAEADGLREIATTREVRVPSPIAQGVYDVDAFLVLEWLPLCGHGDAADLGRRLAALHRHTQDGFGWWRDNHIGATPQPNPVTADWLDFYRERRLRFQFELARQNGAPRGLLDQGERLLEQLADFFPGYRPPPSLLHGDLWGGNHGYADAVPVLFDPAVYFGDREADLAMTELFGGYPVDFYAAYRETWPLDPGYSTRKPLYNLYHLLNHFNLFGGGYGAQAARVVQRLLADIR
jgi:fructosamine-3-kinase